MEATSPRNWMFTGDPVQLAEHAKAVVFGAKAKDAEMYLLRSHGYQKNR